MNDLARRAFSRRGFLKVSLQAALGGIGLYTVSCAPSSPPAASPAPTSPAKPTTAPSQPTAAPKTAPTTAAASAPKALKTVTISTTATAAGLLSEIIRREKYDEQFGLKAEFQTFTPAEAERATALRRVDAGLMVPQAVAQANLEGIPLRIFMPQFLNHISLMVREDAPYRDLEDLKGKKIGTLAKVTSGYQSMAMIARLKRLDYEKDFQLIVGEPPVLMSWLVKGEVDATMVFEPNTSTFLAAEKVRVLKDQQAWWEELHGGPIFTGVVAAHQEWIDRNRDTVKSLQQAYLKAIEFIKTRPQDLTTIYREFFKVDDEKALARLQQRMPGFYNLTWDDKTMASLRDFVRLAADLKILEAVPKDDLFVPLL